MISGDRPDTPVATIRASGVRPSSAALVSLMITTAAAPSLSGQQLPAVTVPSARKTGASPATPSMVTPGARAVVLGDDGAVGGGDGRDLALEEAVGDRLLGAVLRPHAELVLLRAA